MFICLMFIIFPLYQQSSGEEQRFLDSQHIIFWGIPANEELFSSKMINHAGYHNMCVFPQCSPYKHLHHKGELITQCSSPISTWSYTSIRLSGSHVTSSCDSACSIKSRSLAHLMQTTPSFSENQPQTAVFNRTRDQF